MVCEVCSDDSSRYLRAPDVGHTIETGFVLIGRALEERAKLQASADMVALQVLSHMEIDTPVSLWRLQLLFQSTYIHRSWFPRVLG